MRLIQMHAAMLWKATRSWKMQRQLLHMHILLPRTSQIKMFVSWFGAHDLSLCITEVIFITVLCIKKVVIQFFWAHIKTLCRHEVALFYSNFSYLSYNVIIYFSRIIGFISIAFSFHLGSSVVSRINIPNKKQAALLTEDWIWKSWGCNMTHC